MQNLSAKDFFKKTKFNLETQNQIWMSQLADSHDNFCHCNCPFAHLLASIFPPGHKDRDLTINQILQRDYIEACHSTGEEERDGGGERGGTDIKENPDTKEEEDLIKDEELSELIAAAEEDAATR